MAHAVRFYMGKKGYTESEQNGATRPEEDAEEIHQRVVTNVFEQGFPRVLAGDETDAGQESRDQENPTRWLESGIDSRPAHFRGLYRTADEEDIDDFIEAFQEEVLFDAKWFLIEPHDCTHDREQGGPCNVYDGEDLDQNKIVKRGNVPNQFE